MRLQNYNYVTVKSLAVGVSISALAAAVPAAAQDEGQGETYSSTRGVGEIIVTARRRAEDLQDQPLSITALSGDSLKQQNVQRLDDLKTVPNVRFNIIPGFANSMVPVIRGIGDSDPILTNDSPIGFYVDGVLFARQMGNLLEVMDPERIEVLRGPQSSLFGRNTTGGAISITTKMPTRDTNVEFYGSYGTDNDYTARAIINTGDLGDSGFRAKVVAQHRENDGWIKNLNTDDKRYWNGATNVDSLFGVLAFESGDFDATLRGDYTDLITTPNGGQTIFMTDTLFDFYGQSEGLGGDPLVVAEDYIDEIYGEDLPRTPLKHWGTSLTLNYAVSDAVNLKSITAYRKLTFGNFNNTTGQGNLLGQACDGLTGDCFGLEGFGPVVGVTKVTPFSLSTTRPSRSRQKAVSQEFQVSGEMGRHKYIGGLFYFKEDVTEDLHFIFSFPPDFFYLTAPAATLYGGTRYDSESKSFAAYVSDTWTPPILDEKLEITGGFRYTFDTRSITFPANLYGFALGSKKRSWERPSGDLTISYHFDPDVMAYFRYANGYKAGGFGGRDNASQSGFNPETANNFEVGVKSTLFDRLVRFNASAFYTKYTNKQISTYLPDEEGGEPVSRIQNAGKVVYKGIEADLVVVPTEGLQLMGTFGYTDPKYKEFLFQATSTSDPVDISDAARFSYFSKTTYSLGASYTLPELPVGTLTLAANYAFRSATYFHPSDQFNPLNPFLKSKNYKDLDANITLSEIPLAGTELAFSVYGKNLLNEHYRVNAVDYEFGGENYYGTAAYNRPRVIGASVDVKF